MWCIFLFRLLFVGPVVRCQNSIYKSSFAYQFCCFCFERYTIKGADFKDKYFGYSCLDIEETSIMRRKEKGYEIYVYDDTFM